MKFSINEQLERRKQMEKWNIFKAICSLELLFKILDVERFIGIGAVLCF